MFAANRFCLLLSFVICCMSFPSLCFSIDPAKTWYFPEDISEYPGLRCVVYSPNGNYIITGGTDSYVRIWNSTSYELLNTIKAADNIVSLTFIKNEYNVAFATRNVGVYLWDIQSEEVTFLIEPEGYAADSISRLSPASDGSLMSVQRESGPGSVYDLSAGKEIDALWSIGRISEFSPSLDLVFVDASLSDDIPILNLVDYSGTIKAPPLTGHRGDLEAVRVSPDLRYVACVGPSFRQKRRVQEISIWEIETGKQVCHLQGPVGDWAYFNQLCFNANSNLIALSCGYEGIRQSHGEVWIWQYAAGNAPIVIKESKETCIHDCAFTPDDKYFITVNSGNIRFWNVTDIYSEISITSPTTSANKDTYLRETQFPIHSSDILAFQERLLQLGFYPGPIDGVYGPATKRATIEFQVDRGLTVSGEMNNETRRALGIPITQTAAVEDSLGLDIDQNGRVIVLAPRKAIQYKQTWSDGVLFYTFPHSGLHSLDQISQDEEVGAWAVDYVPIMGFLEASNVSLSGILLLGSPQLVANEVRVNKLKLFVLPANVSDWHREFIELTGAIEVVFREKQ